MRPMLAQYAQYYFSLRQASFSQHERRKLQSDADANPSRPADNFRTKLMLRVGVPASNQLRTRSITLAPKHQDAMAPKMRKLKLDAEAHAEAHGPGSARPSAASGAGSGGNPAAHFARSAPHEASVQ